MGLRQCLWMWLKYQLFLKKIFSEQWGSKLEFHAWVPWLNFVVCLDSGKNWLGICFLLLMPWFGEWELCRNPCPDTPTLSTIEYYSLPTSILSHALHQLSKHIFFPPPLSSPFFTLSPSPHPHGSNATLVSLWVVRLL